MDGAVDERPYPISEVPLWVNVLGDGTRIARALGLDVELPDLEIKDPAYWERFWKTD
jgi:hypothetical protein